MKLPAPSTRLKYQGEQRSDLPSCLLRRGEHGPVLDSGIEWLPIEFRFPLWEVVRRISGLL